MEKIYTPEKCHRIGADIADISTNLNCYVPRLFVSMCCNTRFVRLIRLILESVDLSAISAQIRRHFSGLYSFVGEWEKYIKNEEKKIPYENTSQFPTKKNKLRNCKIVLSRSAQICARFVADTLVHMATNTHI